MIAEEVGGNWTTKRLPNEEQVGTRTGFSVVGGILFGTPFVVFGVAGVLAGMKVFGEAFERGRHAPHWVFVLFGLFFIIAGSGIWALTARMVLAEKARRRTALEHGGHPAFADYPWNAEEFVANPWPKVIHTAMMTVIMAVFLVPFHYFIFKDAWAKGAAIHARGEVGTGQAVMNVLEKVNVVPALFLVVFDGIILWSLGALALSVIRAARFGKGRLKWSVFPILPGSEATLNFELPRAIGSFDEAVVELRCIKEFWETRGTGKNSSRTMVHEQIWAESRTASANIYDKLGCGITVKFSIPASAPSTSLSAEMPIFWRADLRVKMAGPDYIASFLVPVYAKAAAGFPVANGGVRI
jgi:hypothetical protein